MPKVTIGFGVLLLLLAVGGFAYLHGDSHAVHALIPGIFGVLLVLCGAMANTENLKRRALWMHIAVTLGLLGFLGTVGGLVKAIRMAAGAVSANPFGAVDQAITAVLCLIFVVVCVRSFISARRARLA